VVRKPKVPDVNGYEEPRHGRGRTRDGTIGHKCHPINLAFVVSQEANLCPEVSKTVLTPERLAAHQYAMKVRVACEVTIDKRAQARKIFLAQGRRGCKQ